MATTTDVAQQINAVGDLDHNIDGEVTFTYNWLTNQRDIALDPKERDQATDPRTRDMGISAQDKRYFRTKRKSQLQDIENSIKSMDKNSYRKSVIDDINKSMERDGLSQSHSRKPEDMPGHLSDDQE